MKFNMLEVFGLILLFTGFGIGMSEHISKDLVRPISLILAIVGAVMSVAFMY